MEPGSIHIQAGGSISGIINTGTISGDLSQLIGQLPADKSGETDSLRELLAKLQKLIEAEPSLTEEDRSDALQQVKTLTKVGLEQGSSKEVDVELAKAGRMAMKILKGTAAGLVETTKMVLECNKLLPAIANLLSLL